MKRRDLLQAHGCRIEREGGIWFGITAYRAASE
jgi:hypothetical protein